MIQSPKSLGLYIHIPFCKRKCLYCDFLSFDNQEYKNKYLDALVKEISLSSKKYKDYLVDTVYIGGGTPSVLDCDELDMIGDALAASFAISKDAEITMEMNPGTNDYVPGFVNRLSVGVQSFSDERLKVLGRIHDSVSAKETLKKMRKKVDRLSCDLMFGLPGQTKEEFFSDIKTAVDLRVDHISLYSLIVEEGTPFKEMYGEGGAKVKDLPQEDVERAMYHGAVKLAEAAGLIRYEISNFAKPGCESAHNIRYWKRKDYLGLGLGASSFAFGERFKNPDDFESYIKGVKLPAQKIDEVEAMEETMFLGLRLSKGVSISGFYDTFGKSIYEIYGEEIERHVKSGLIIESEDSLKLSDRGIDISNFVLSSFIRG